MGAGRLVREADEAARVGDYAAALALREQAYTALRVDGELAAAARLAAYQIAFDHVALFGNGAVASGWLERGIHLVEETGACAEAGWVALARALHAGDPSERDHWIAAAERAAEEFGDGDLAFDALAYRGHIMVEAGRVTDGMRRLDEAAAAAYAGEVVSPTVSGEIYCKLMVACETVLDVPRAEQWHGVFAALERGRDVAWASAICRMHVGAIWTVAGRWQDAEQELTRSLELYDATYRALRPAACARLAELWARQGRLNEAEQLLALGRGDRFSVRPAARVGWRRAVTDSDQRATVAVLAEALDEHGADLAVLPDLAVLTELRLACGLSDDAARSARAVAELATADVGEALRGYARLVAGLIALSTSDDVGGRDELRQSVRHFAAARLPLERARAQVALAEACAAADSGTALAEAREAAETFAWLDAADELDRASAVLRSVGGRRPPPMSGSEDLLTAREHEVLVLVADGLSNPEIADRLFLSRKTVAHHVSNVLAKLGVRNRAEAAAWFSARTARSGSDES
jgi:DNA-binding CsgD family transcriptional regulator